MPRRFSSILILFLTLESVSPGKGCNLAQAGTVAGGNYARRELLASEEIPVVVAATKREQSTIEAPSSVTIITADDIQKYGYRTLGDALTSVRGLYVTYDRNYTTLGVRGFSSPSGYNVKILLLVNGHYFNDDVYGGAYLGTEFGIDMDIVERIEIVRGPGSALYGTNAFFAVINVVTREGKDIKGLRASSETGSYTFRKGIVTYGTGKDELDFLVSAGLMDTRGQTLFFKEFDDPSTNDGFAEKADGDESHNIFMKLSYGEFSLHGTLNKRTKYIPAASFGTKFNADETRTDDARDFIELKYAHKITDTRDFLLRVYYDRLRYMGHYLYEGPPDVMNLDKGEGDWYGGEFQYNWEVFENNRFTAGAEYQDHDVLQKNWDKDPYAQRLKDSRTFDIKSFYLQDEWSLCPDITVTMGVRYDDHSMYDKNTSPRIGFVLGPYGRSVIKLLYGEAFRGPSVYELFYNDGGLSQMENPDLQPEEIKTYELVLEQRIANDIKGIVSLYHYDISNLITSVDDPLSGMSQFQNMGNVQGGGAELGLRRTWENGIRGFMNISYQESENEETKKEMVNSPEVVSNAGISVPVIGSKAYLSAETRYISRRLTLSDEHTGGYYLTNVIFFAPSVWNGFDISVSIRNLFNTGYADPGSPDHVQDAIPQDGRNFWFKITCVF
jgi:iron complex outermembrane receptor protein